MSKLDIEPNADPIEILEMSTKLLRVWWDDDKQKFKYYYKVNGVKIKSGSFSWNDMMYQYNRFTLIHLGGEKYEVRAKSDYSKPNGIIPD